MAALLELEMFTTSAKDNVNIETVFLHLANSYFKAPVVQSASIKRFTYSPRSVGNCECERVRVHVSEWRLGGGDTTRRVTTTGTDRRDCSTS